MLKIIALDDEAHALERFEKICSQLDGVEVCGLYQQATDLLDFIEESDVDAIFLDIEMPEQSGLELAEDILNIKPDSNIIFSTAFNQYAVDAFEVNAVDYLVKPIHAERLKKALERVKDRKKVETTEAKPVIQCFGGFEVYVNNTAIKWRSQKAKEILALLTHYKGRSVTWEKVADALWENDDYEKVHSSFHTTMFRLRKTLSEYGINEILECGRGNYRINTEQVQCDLMDLKPNEKRNGYMENEGYLWAYAREAELMVAE